MVHTHIYFYTHGGTTYSGSDEVQMYETGKPTRRKQYGDFSTFIFYFMLYVTVVVLLEEY